MKRVLVVDDEPDIAALVALCLDPLGVSVVQADCLDGALTVARTANVGLVLLDLALGKEDGLQVLPQLRQEPSLSNVPIVAFSAHDSRRKQALEAGVDYFLPRPFDTTNLQTIVERYLVH